MDENKSIGQAPEQIGAGAWELWEWPGDGRTRNDPISVLDEVVKKIILAYSVRIAAVDAILKRYCN